MSRKEKGLINVDNNVVIAGEVEMRGINSIGKNAVKNSYLISKNK